MRTAGNRGPLRYLDGPKTASAGIVGAAGPDVTSKLCAIFESIGATCLSLPLFSPPAVAPLYLKGTPGHETTGKLDVHAPLSVASVRKRKPKPAPLGARRRPLSLVGKGVCFVL